MREYLIPRKIALSGFAVFLLLVTVNMTGLVCVENLTGAIPLFCPFKAITNVPCPGCGMTRAMASLINGHPGDAALYNPFCFFLLFIMALSMLPSRILERGRRHLGRALPTFYSAALALVLVYWVVDRLLPSVFG